MKTLFRLAALSFCAAVGILLAVQLARPTADAIAASVQPSASPSDAEPVRSAPAPHVPRSASGYAGMLPKPSPIQPRTAADASHLSPAAAARAGFEPLHVAQAPTSGGNLDAGVDNLDALKRQFQLVATALIFDAGPINVGTMRPASAASSAPFSDVSSQGCAIAVETAGNVFACAMSRSYFSCFLLGKFALFSGMGATSNMTHWLMRRYQGKFH